MAFVVDSQEWVFDGWSSEEVEAAIEDILDRFDAAFKQQHDVWIGEDLQTQLVYHTYDLWSLRAATAQIRIAEEIWQELAAALGRTKRYLDEEHWPPGFDEYSISVDGAPPEINPDIAWAHHNVRVNRPVACLGLKRKGVFATTSQLGTANVHWIGNGNSCALFWREAIQMARNEPAALEFFAPYAYPRLYFVPGVWRGLSKLSGGYYPHSAELQRYLSVLSDAGEWAFTAPPPAEVISEAQDGGAELPPSQLIIRRFIRLGLNVTPENPNVFQDKTCREARELKVFGKTLYFEWHGKLQDYQNRIHIHPPVAGTEGRVLVGIIDAHLPLP